MAKQMEKQCPDAWMLNFSNPEQRLCEAVNRLTSARVVGLCHGVFMGQHQISQMLGIPREKLQTKACGLNHFTFFEEIRHKDPRLPVFAVLSGDQNMSFAYWGPRLAAGMAMAFGVLALLLATMGLYAVMTYAVSQRTREIGIRMALGAQVRDVMKIVISHGLLLVVVGLVIGLSISLVAGRLFASLLLGIGTKDPLTLIGVSVVLLVVGLLACFIPARRATKVDPLVALKYE